jgi:tetratricopeptide (TPR) repeat protein
VGGPLSEPAGRPAIALPAALRIPLRHPVHLVIGIAAAVRLLYLLALRASPFFAVPVVDAETYSQMAQAIAAGDLRGGDTVYWQAPLYPYFLGLLTALHLGPLGVRLVQFGLGAASAGMLVALGARIGGPRVGLIAGLGAAFYGPFLFFEGRLLAPALIVFLNTAGLLMLERARGVPGLRPRAAAGACFGLAALARPDAFLAAIVLAIGLAWSESRGSGAPARRAAAWRRAAIFVGTALLVTLPVTARNWIVARDLVWISANGGINFYLGNNPQSAKTVAIRPGREWEALVETPHREAGLTRASDRSRYFYARALHFAVNEPLAFARHGLAKTAQFFSGPEIPREEDPYTLRGESALLDGLLWRFGGFGFPFGIVAPLAVLGAVVLWPRRRAWALVYLFAAAYTVAVIAFFVTSRYRLPAVPALLLLAAGAVDWLIARAAETAVRVRFGLAFGTLAIVCALLPGAVGSGFPAAEPGPDHWRLLAITAIERKNPREAVEYQAQAVVLAPHRAELHYDLGLYKSAAGDTAGAIAAYRMAIAIDPKYGEPRVNLGHLLVARGDFPGAVEQYLTAAHDHPGLVPAQVAAGLTFFNSGAYDSALARYAQAVAADPMSTPARTGQAMVLERMGRTDEAVRTLRDAIAVQGEKPELLQALGQRLKDARRYPEAVVALKRALARAPADAEIWVTLGQCYRHLDRLEDAEEAQKRAIALAPRLAAAHVNLGDVYARRGLYDQAIASLERALAIEPYNTSAIYNLAVIHVEMGQEDHGVVLLERLLRIDPQHAPARHALAELRGEPHATGAPHTGP